MSSEAKPKCFLQGFHNGPWPWQEHEHCDGDAAACETLFQERNRSYQGLVQGQTTMDGVRKMVEAYKQSGPGGSDGDKTPVGKASSSLNFSLFASGLEQSPAISSASGKSPAPKKAKKDVADCEIESVDSWLVPPSDPDAEASQPSQPEEPKQQKRGKPKAAAAAAKKYDELILKADTALKKNRETFSDAALWNSKMRPRVKEAAVKTLTALSTQLLTVSGDPEADNLCEAINAWCNGIEARFETITSIRKDAVAMAAHPSPEAIEVLKSMNVTNLSALLLHTGAECLKLGIEGDDAGSDAANSFFRLCSCLEDASRVNVFLVLVSARRASAEEMARTVCSNFQQQLLSMWMDRLFKQKQPPRFRRMVDECHGFRKSRFCLDRHLH